MGPRTTVDLTDDKPEHPSSMIFHPMEQGASVQEGGHAREATMRFRGNGQKNPNRIRVGILSIGGAAATGFEPTFIES
jgi:hypothetical protein